MFHNANKSTFTRIVTLLTCLVIILKTQHSFSFSFFYLVWCFEGSSDILHIFSLHLYIQSYAPATQLNTAPYPSQSPIGGQVAASVIVCWGQTRIKKYPLTFELPAEPAAGLGKNVPACAMDGEAAKFDGECFVIFLWVAWKSNILNVTIYTCLWFLRFIVFKVRGFHHIFQILKHLAMVTPCACCQTINARIRQATLDLDKLTALTVLVFLLQLTF